MRTSFHHQPEAQHQKSPAIETPAGRLPHLSADFVAEVGDQCIWALNRLFLKLSVADRSIGSGGFDAMAPTPTTAMPRTRRLLVVVGRPAWRAGVGSVR